jgi:hypothetical protein
MEKRTRDNGASGRNRKGSRLTMEWQTRKRANEQKRINAKAEKVKGEKLDNGMANKEKGKRTKKDKRKS